MLGNTSRFPWCINLLVVAAVLSTPRHACVAQDEDEDFAPGLLAGFTAEGQTVNRIDSSLSFDWSANAPDERLPTGSFKAEWSGNLLAKQPGIHQFHTFVAGNVQIAIDGNTVLDASNAWGFSSGPKVELSAGDHEIQVRYSTPAESDKPRARLSVFWSSDKFTLEPLPADVLYREDPKPTLTDRGRHLADAFRCAACHQNASDMEVVKAPALDRIKGSQTTAQLVQRLKEPSSAVANSQMPDFGFNDDEAASVAAFLQSVSKDAAKESALKFKDKDASEGTRLLNSLGCVACHAIPGMQATTDSLAAPYDGPELVNVGKRRTASWLDRWLRDPSTLNNSHRMPKFDLSKDERRQLVAALIAANTADRSETSVSTNAEKIEKGRKLVTSANCAACHDIPGIKPQPFESLGSESFKDNSAHCLLPRNESPAHSDNGQRRPSYPRLVGDKADSIMSWFGTVRYHSKLSASDQGQLLLKRKGCLACHNRDSNRGLSTIANSLQKTHEGLKGQSQGLIPPPLTAVGDRLNNDYLQKAIAGEQQVVRLPWLFVRMPKFGHSNAERNAIMHHLITSDRIPDEADSARQDILRHIDLTGKSQATTEDLLLGNQLTGAGGFNCVACHQAGQFEPRNVALGTRGSDIMTMGKRIRPRFFQRWMKNPIRVVAGIEMPAIRKAMPDVLDASLPAQIGAMWTALSDSRFTPPTVTSRFEQVVNVSKGEQPRIIRDVFTIGLGKDREPVARAMAIGFGNGHNILLDLDRMQVRLWTMGEFARQRTEGKSWYWDMPGFLIQHKGAIDHSFQLATKDGETLTPLADEGRQAELLTYKLLKDGIELTCAWRFLPDQDKETSTSKEPHFAKTTWDEHGARCHRVVTRHVFRSEDKRKENKWTGWQHEIIVLEAPAESHLTGWLGVFREPSADQESSIPVQTSANRVKLAESESATAQLTVEQSPPHVVSSLPKPVLKADKVTVTTVPGFTGTRLPVDASIMPTSMTWLADGRLAFTSLKGHVWIAEDSDGDEIPDRTSLFEEGLAAPFGILPDGDSLIVSHKPEILRLRDADGDGRADTREVVASGWGFNDNYHDWASGLIRDEQGNMYVGLGSDYSQKTRPADQDRWRGGVIKVDPSGVITPLGMSMRYPMGLALDRHGNLFATDNQGVQNTFNEINHIIEGKHYGVPSRHQPTDGLVPEIPGLMVPHPWTRSVNSILFLPDDFPVATLRGHGIGCEYDSRFLIRFTVQNVNGTLQGASYRFSLPEQEAGGSNFIGPICSAISPKGELYIGSIWDSGWQGGRNTGGITRLVASAKGLPNGIRELTATAEGFDVEFFKPVDQAAAKDAGSWSIQAYTRKWGGAYATPDSGRHTLQPDSIEVLENGKRVRISVSDLKAGYLYDVSTSGKLGESEKLWPSEAHYSMKVVPK